MAESAQGQQVSTVGAKWARRMAFIMIIAFGLGSWALYDATIVYPRKGEAFAEWAEWQYLTAINFKSQAAGFAGNLTVEAPVKNPKEELEFLRKDEAGRANDTVKQARFQWLNALATIRKLSADATDFDPVAPRDRLNQLEQEWSSRPQPAPLAALDLPAQWLMLIIGYGLGLYMLYLVARVAMTKYRWEPASKTLILPGGAAIRPHDLAEVDKRKWDKFIVFLRIKQGVDKIGGQTIRVDTYRHGLVEDWILEMEREEFGAEEEPETAEPARDPESGDALASAEAGEESTDQS